MIKRLRRLLKQPTIFQRIILVTTLINIVAVFMLLSGRQLQNESQLYGMAAESLPNQLALIVRELKKETGIIADPILHQHDQFKPDSNLYAVCVADQATLYESAALQRLGGANLCENFGTLHPDALTAPQLMANGGSYYVYPIRFLTQQGDRTLIVLRDASESLAELQKLNRKDRIQLMVVLALVILLMVRAAAWGIRPIRNLLEQINEIIRGERVKLGEPEARELRGISYAINEMLHQSKTRKTTYQNAMKDLAHSLKTRLTATHALVDEYTDYDSRARQALYEQLGQMDEMIQYQLRKASMGRQGLSQQQIEIPPLVAQISQMLDKVYPDKGIRCELALDDKLKFPGGKDDLMEICGNLMENAYRFANSQVRVTSRYNEKRHCEIWVEDDGPGIAPELRQRVLKRGERADERHPGQGIGLAVCNEIVHTYNGTLLIDQSSLGGARLRLEFPLHQSQRKK